MNTLPESTQSLDFEFLRVVSKAQLGLLLTAIFERVGYYSTPGNGLSLYEIDLILYNPIEPEAEIAVRCRPDSIPVTGNDIALFLRRIKARGYEKAVFVTNNTFRSSALEFVGEPGLVLVDAARLKAGINDLEPEHRAAVLEVFESLKDPVRSEGDAAYFAFAAPPAEDRALPEPAHTEPAPARKPEPVRTLSDLPDNLCDLPDLSAWAGEFPQPNSEEYGPVRRLSNPVPELAVSATGTGTMRSRQRIDKLALAAIFQIAVIVVATTYYIFSGPGTPSNRPGESANGSYGLAAMAGDIFEATPATPVKFAADKSKDSSAAVDPPVDVAEAEVRSKSEF